MAYIFMFISNLFKELNQNQKKYNKQLDKINNCMQHNQISKSLRLRILKYLEYEYREGINNKYTILQNIGCISKYLKEEIVREVNIKILSKIPLFTKHFSTSFLQKMAFKLTEQAYGP